MVCISKRWPASTTFEIFKGPLKISKVVEAGQMGIAPSDSKYERPKS